MLKEKGIVISSWRVETLRACNARPDLSVQIERLFLRMQNDVIRAKTVEEIKQINQRMYEAFWALFKPRK
jgi:hypothetical protein